MLSDSVILNKTEQGRLVISQRLDAVRAPERAMLVLVDGKTAIGQLRVFLSSVKAGESAFEELLAKGLVEIKPRSGRREKPAAKKVVFPDFTAERFDELYQVMVAISASFLGLRGYFLQLRIERCASLAELETVRPDLLRAIAARHGDQVAQALSRRLA